MKKITSLIIGCALVAVPALALAEETNTSVEAEASANVTSGTPPQDPRKPGEQRPPMRPGMQVRASTTIDARKANMQLRASTTAEARKGSMQERQDNRIAEAKARAAMELDRRIENLTKMQARIDTMVLLAPADKTALKASLMGQINGLGTLKGKIESETATTTLRTDIQSITKSYRIYALVIPQAAITAAADRVLAVATLSEQLSVKLKTRIDAVEAAGTDVSTLNASLSDMNAKVADAKVQANAAISLVVDLKPDNNDETLMKANMAALKDARANIEAGQKALKAAREDAESIMKALGKPKVRAEGKASTTVEIE